LRVSKEKAAEHRHQIIRAAARLFREKGIGATGVDSITSEADLTHGVIYSQFGSKDAITLESVRTAMRGSKRVWLQALAKRGRQKALTAIVKSYLSQAHRDAPGRGCLVAALGGEISRQPRKIRDAFTEELREDLDFLTEVLASDDRSITAEDALAVFATMSGALVLSRAVTDTAFSQYILRAIAKWIEDHLNTFG
jgi:TetR/AcrR family transcriptional regulator, transcriptional repressor for nem operon